MHYTTTDLLLHFSLISIPENGAVDMIDAVNTMGYTCLHTAAEKGRTNVRLTELLLDNHANKSMTNNDGKTPLEIAESRGHKRIARTLRWVLSWQIRFAFMAFD